MDEGKAVDVVYLNFSKAFDTVPHNILMENVAAHSLDGRTLRWVKHCWTAGPKELWSTELNPVGAQSQVVSPRGLSWDWSSSASLSMI